MKKTLSLFLTLVVLLGLLAGCGDQGAADTDGEDWPKKDIAIDVCYSAGGTSDTCARALAVEMGKSLGVNISVQNITGGSGSICGQTVAQSPADGYTWMSDVAHTASGWKPMDYCDLNWTDFYGFYAGTAPYVLFVAKDSPYKTFQELFDAMEADPAMKWGNAGLGSINQLTGQLMMDTLGLKGNSIPYDGGRTAALKVISHEVVWSWCGITDIMDLANTGDIKVLGVCDAEPLHIAAATGEYDAPSLLQEHPDLEILSNLLYWGIRVSRDTPQPIVAKIQAAFDDAVASESFKEYCEANSMTLDPITGAESDEICAKLESIYAWGLFDNGLGSVSPETYGVPRIDDFAFSANDAQKSMNPWPAK